MHPPISKLRAGPEHERKPLKRQSFWSRVRRGTSDVLWRRRRTDAQQTLQGRVAARCGAGSLVTGNCRQRGYRRGAFTSPGRQDLLPHSLQILQSGRLPPRRRGSLELRRSGSRDLPKAKERPLRDVRFRDCYPRRQPRSAIGALAWVRGFSPPQPAAASDTTRTPREVRLRKVPSRRPRGPTRSVSSRGAKPGWQVEAARRVPLWFRSRS